MTKSAPQLKRQIGFFSATIIVIANMVGSGIFTTSGFVMSELNTAEQLLTAWLIGGLFALIGAFCYAELGAMFPEAGGEYVYLKSAYGDLPAFLSGWISLIVGFSAPIAAAAIAFATYFFGSTSLPEPGLDLLENDWIKLSPVTLLAIVAVVVFSLLHLHSVHIGKGIQNLLTLYKVGFIILFIILGFTLGNGDFEHFRPSRSVSEEFNFSSFAVALIFISFAYSGWNAAAYLGSEIRRPEKNLPWALIAGTLFVLLLYILLNLLYLYALPPQQMAGQLDIGQTAATALFDSKIGFWFSAAIAFGLLSVMSAMIMAGPRVYFAMAQDGLFPDHFGRIHPTRHTPAAAILLQAAIAIVMIILSAYDTLLIYIGFTLSLSAIITVAGLMVLRRNRPDLKRPYRTPGYPWIPLTFIGGNFWILGYTLYSRPEVAFYGFFTLLIGLLPYGFFKRKQRRTNKNPISCTLDLKK